jgi:hypothetical protein
MSVAATNLMSPTAQPLVAHTASPSIDQLELGKCGLTPTETVDGHEKNHNYTESLEHVGPIDRRMRRQVRCHRAGDFFSNTFTLYLRVLGLGRPTIAQGRQARSAL